MGPAGIPGAPGLLGARGPLDQQELMVHRDNEVLQANRARMEQRESQELAVNGAKLVPRDSRT